MSNATTERKGMVTPSSHNGLIRLEEFLREDLQKSEGIKVIFNWTDEHGNPIKDSDGTEETG